MKSLAMHVNNCKPHIALIGKTKFVPLLTL